MHNSKQKIVVSALFGLVLSISCVDFKDISDPTIASILLNVFLWPLFSLISYLVLYVISRYSFSVEHKRIPLAKFILYMIPSVAVPLIYLVAFYPGIMTVDSIVQWKEAQAILTGNWSQVSDHHPATHTALLALIISIWHSPAAVVVFQILCVSSIIAYGAYSLEKAGIRKNVVWMFVIVLSINPSFGIIIITLWKDVLFSAGLTFLTIIIMNMVISNGEYLRTFRGLLLLFVAMLMVLLFRHNGMYALVLSIPLIIVIHWRTDPSHWKDLFSKGHRAALNSGIVRFSATFMAALFLYVIITNNVYHALNISPIFEGQKYTIPLNVMGGVLKNGSHITSEQYLKAAKILPIHEWLSSYDPYFADPIKDNDYINHDAYLNNKREFFILLSELCLQNPREAIRSYAAITSIIWRIRNTGYTYAYSSGINPETKERYGMEDTTVVSESLCPPLKSLLSDFLWLTTSELYSLGDPTEPKLSPARAVPAEALSFFWRPALFLYLSMLFAVGSAFINGLKSLCVPLVVIANSMIVALSIPAQDFRYLYCNVLSFGFVMLFSFIKFNKAT